MRDPRSFPVLVLLLVSCSPQAHTDADGPRPGMPGEAARFRYSQRLDPDGTMPVDALVRARRQRDALVASQRPGPAGPAWRWLGPGNIGGRVRAILTHPGRDNVMWLGSVSGGIWKTLDGGASWSALDDFMASLAVNCMAMDPTDPDVLYAGTGEGYFNHDAVRGAGIFRSTNGGQTWTRIPTTAPSAAQPQWRYVNRIAIHPANPRIILAATNEGIFRTADGGATAWTRQTRVRAYFVDFHPTNGMRAIASQRTTARPDGVALFSSNGGLDWNPARGLPAGADRIELARARAAPATVFASVARKVGAVHSTAGLYASTDGGQSYTARNTTDNYLDKVGWYANAIWVDPTDASARRLVVGGLDLYRSLDGGATLTKISEWQRVPNPGDSAHADHHAIVHHRAYNGSTNRVVFFACDGGIYRANDVVTVAARSGWTPRNNGLGVTQFFGAAVNSTTGVILGGTQDNATLRYPGTGTDWTTTGLRLGGGKISFTGDSGFCAATRGRPGTFFGELVYLELFRSTDGGVTADPIDAGLGDAGNPARAAFIAPFLLDPNDPNRLLAGGVSLWRSNNANAVPPAWTAIKPPDGATPSKISAITVAEGNPDLVWVGHADGKLYRTTNGTAAVPAWKRVDRNPPGLPARYCSRIVIDGKCHNRVFVTFMGFQPDNVWVTTDSGDSFAERTGGRTLPSIPVSAIALQRTNPERLYIGTDLGVFSSRDGGRSWSAVTQGPANVVVDELVWQGDRTLLAVTHGRGVYAADVGPPAAPVTGRTARASVSSGGAQASGGSSVSPAISADGRYVAFSSNASNLVPSDTNRSTDIFVHDRVTGVTTRASVPSIELRQTQANFGSFYCSISAGGRLVAFDSQATNLVAGDTNGRPDVFVHDRATGKTARVSISSSKAQGNGSSSRCSISPNGRFVAFYSLATNLVAGDTNNAGDVFLHDRTTGTTTRVSVDSLGRQGNGQSYDPSVSDGGVVAFSSRATNLVTSDTNLRPDVFVHDSRNGATTRVNVSSSGDQANGQGFDWPRITADGLTVVFDSLATNLVPGDTNSRPDVFVHDRRTAVTTRVSLSSSGQQGNNTSRKPAVSLDGRFVTFESAASNLVANDTNARTDTFVRDRELCTTIRASVSSTGQEANQSSGGLDPFVLSVSADGRAIAFQSAATNLVPGDTNNLRDVFVHDAMPVLAAEGSAGLGKTVTFRFHAPEDSERLYVMAASLGTAPGIPVDTRVIPLNPDTLFFLSFQLPAVFESFAGVLDRNGQATAKLHVPQLPFLIGLEFFVGGFTVRPGAPSNIGTIALPVPVIVVP